MSGLFGWVGLGGRPACRDSLARMATALSGWGEGRSTLWLDGALALGRFETGPAGTACVAHPLPSGGWLWASSRLCNRDELAGALAIPAGEALALSDDALLARAYRYWGEDCLDRLEGEWSFAAWHPERAELLLARDHHGNTSLFYYQGPDFLAFAFSLKALLAIPALPRGLDTTQVARLLIPGWGPHPTETPYRDVHRLAPAHVLTVTPGQRRTRRYWRLEDTAELRLGSDAEYIEAFAEIFTRAVRGRLRADEPTGVTLSSGMDSSAVALEAAAALAESGRRLPAYCYVPIHATDGLLPPGRLADESPVVRETAARLGNVDTHWIGASERSPLAGVREVLDTLAQPATGVNNIYWIFSLLATAHRQGTRVLLIGQGGNATLSWWGRGAMARLALAGRWSRLATELRAASEFRGIPVKQLLTSEVLAPLLPASLFSVLKWLMGRETTVASPLLRPDFIQKHRLLERLRDEGRDPHGGISSDSRRNQARVIQPGRNTLMANWHQLGAAHGIEVLDPTFDKRLMAFAWAIPPEQHLRGGGRALVRHAMADRLPDSVLHPRTRGYQSSDLFPRLHASREEIAQALGEVKSSAFAAEVLDLSRLAALVERLEQPPPPSTDTRIQSNLLQALQAGLFLAGHEGR